MAPRYSLARRKAQDILRDIHIRKPPVPVEDIAGLVGALIHYEPYEGQVSGLVHRQPDNSAVIGVNSSHSITRQRFTIAHEIAHLLLHRNERFHVDERAPIGFRNEESSLATKDPEIEANQFAAELLMPAKFLVSEIKSLPNNMETELAIQELADRFQVSEQAMTLRLTNLGFLA
jgi:Zn-dependent peptidase ImmA (M78 family)